MSEEEKDEQDNQDQETQDEVVEEIEEETSEGLLGGFSKEAVLAGGVLLGIAVGLMTGYALTAAGPGEAQEVSPQQVQDDLEQILTAGDEEMADQIEISTPERRHGMYYTTFTTEVEQPVEDGTETVEQEQSVYTSIDGEKIFPEIPGQSPMDREEVLQMIEQQPEEPAQQPEDESLE